MDAKYNKKILSFLFIIVTAVTLLIFTGFYFYTFLHPYALQNWLELSDHWTYYTDRLSSVQPLDKYKKIPGVAPNDTLYMERALHERTESSTLMIKYYYQHLTVYLDGERVAENGSPGAQRNPGVGLILLPLTAEDKGKTLRLEIRSPYALYAGFPKPVHLGDTASLPAYLISDALDHLFFLFVCAVIGFFFITYSCLSIYRGKNQWDSLFFGLFSILLGFFCICRDDIIYLIFPPVAASLIAIGLHIVYLIPLMAYFYCHLKTLKKLVRVILISLCGIAGLAYLLQFLGIAEFPDIVFAYNIILTLAFTPVIGIVLYELIHNNRVMRFLSPVILLVIVFSWATGMYYNDSSQPAVPYYLNAVFLLVIGIWIYHLREFVVQRIQEKKDMQALKFRNEITQREYDGVLARMNDLRVMRHEIGHHIAALKILNQTGESDRVAEYLDAIASDFDKTAARYSENALVNSIFSYHLHRAREAGIQVSHDIQVPAALPVEDPDLSSLLFNLLDNAVEANLRLPQDAKRWISFRLQFKGNLLAVSCCNASPPVVMGADGSPRTLKSNENHGYGVSIIRSIVKKYGGSLKITHENGVFRANAFLQTGAAARYSVPK